MSIENIVIEDNDTLIEQAKKICLIYAGSTELGKQLAKLGITHTKTYKGSKIMYVLRGAKIETTQVIL